MEVLKVLEEEIALREETRALEQAREALEEKDYWKRVNPLVDTQTDLAERTDDVINKIRELPNGEQSFAKEIALLSRVVQVMGEAESILARPDTGPEAIAAETEVIELLMQARRMNPGGGGGGGSSPGGGGSGDTDQSALASIGPGRDRDAKVDDRGVDQATGVSGSTLPDEFRGGLDAYFDALEGRSRLGSE